MKKQALGLDPLLDCMVPLRWSFAIKHTTFGSLVGISHYWQGWKGREIGESHQDPSSLQIGSTFRWTPISLRHFETGSSRTWSFSHAGRSLRFDLFKFGLLCRKGRTRLDLHRQFLVGSFDYHDSWLR